jgi:hypothetical protein
MPPVVAAVSSAVAWYGAQALAVQFVVRVAVGFAISAVASKLLVKQPGSTSVVSDPGRQESIRQALSPWRTIYGETLTGGVIVYVETHGTKNKQLSVLTARAAHEIAGFEELYFGDERLLISSNAVSSPTHSRYTNRAYSYTHLGTDDQAADSELLTRTAGGWTSAHRLRGIAYDHLLLFYNVPDAGEENVWADFRIDGIKYRMRGKKVYDPRDAATKYSANPVLLLRDYLTARLNVTSAEINDTVAQASANVCDEQVTLVTTSETFTASASTDVLTLTEHLDNLRRGNVVRVSNSGGALPTGLSAGTDYYLIPVGPLTYKLASSFANAMTGTAIDLSDAGTGTHTLTLRSEPRYTAHGVVLDTDDPGEVIEGLLGAMAGTLTYTGGKFEIHAGAASSSVVTLDEDSLAGGITVQARRSRRELFNAVKATYVDPDKNYQPTTAPGVENSTYEDQDNGEQIWQTVDLPFCDSPTRAQRLSKIALERCRQQIVITFPAKLVALKVKIWDVVSVTNSRFGWSAKEFRVIGWALNPSGAIDLTLAEEAAAMWDWSAEETAVDPAPDTNLPDFRTVEAPPTPLGFSEEIRLSVSGTPINVLKVAVTATPDVFASRYRWEYLPPGATAYVPLPTTLTNIEIVGVEDGAMYTVRVAAENDLGYRSSYTSGTYTVIGQSEAPENVTGFAVNIIGHQAHLSWDSVSDIDLKAYRIRYTAELVTPSWGSAVDACPLVARPATSVVLPARTGTWLIKAVDFAGHESTTASTTAAAIGTLDGLNVVATVTEDPAFAGTHSDTFSTGSALTLSTTGDEIGDWLTLGSIAAIGLGLGAVVSEGTYTFANAVDLGAVYTSRVTADIDVTGEDYNNAIGNWPTLGEVLQLGGDAPGNYDVTLQVRTTNDNPAGTPTWTGWRNFIVGDYTCRAYQFRAVLKSFFGTVAPLVTGLSVTVDMPDRIEHGEDASIASGGTAVTYVQAFKATPALAITAQNMGTGEYYEFTAKSATGFTIRFKNAAAANVGPRTIDWTAQGY